MQKYQIARPESCFIGQNLLIIQFCLQIYFFFGQLNQSQKYIVYDISVFLEVTANLDLLSNRIQYEHLFPKNCKSYCWNS